MQHTLKLFKEKLKEELKEVDFSSLYEDIDILSCIDEYEEIQHYIVNPEIEQISRKNIERELYKIERDCLRKIKAIKIIGEEKNYYLLRGEPYNINGIIIESYFNEYLEEDNLFCEYKGDNIYSIMRNNLNKKIKKYNNIEEY